MAPLLLLALLACSSNERGASPPAPAVDRPAPPPVPAGKMKNAVVLVIDTLRADAVERARTPNLDGLSVRGAQHAWAWAPSTWTAPSMVSLFSGMHVRQHGWDFPFPNKMDLANARYPELPATPLLAEVLQQAGFQTAGHYANSLIGRELGFARGFDHWELGGDAQVTARSRRTIQGWREEDRNFLYIHLFGPHHPLKPKERSREHWGLTREQLGRDKTVRLPEVRQGGPLQESTYWRAYHAVVEDTDERVGLILEALRPHLDDTVFIVTSDHGELLGEHGDHGHSGGVWEPLTRVPFIVVNGPLLPDRVQTAALPDVVTDALGLDHDWPVQLGAGGQLVVQREGAVAVTVDGRDKAVWDERAFDGPVQFDLVVDPDEEKPAPLTSQELVQARAVFDARVPENQLQPEAGGMDAAMLEALEALGYMGDD